MIVAALLLASCGSSRSEEEIAAANASLVAGGASSGGVGPAGGAGTVGAGTSTGSGSTATGGAAVGSTPGAVSSGGAAAGGADPAAGGAATGGGAAGGAAGPATGAPIVVGSLGTFSGPLGSIFEPGRQGILMWASWLNARGGIGGRPVQVVVADDQGDPSQHLSIIRDMVERQGAIAILNNLGVLTSASAASYLEQAGIPVIGGDGVNDAYVNSPMYFPNGSNFASFTGGLATQAHLAGLTRIGVLGCAESSLCSAGIQNIKEYAGRYGDIEVVYEAQITLTAPDYTAECLAASGQDVDFLVVGADASSVGRVVASCSRQGYNPVIGVVSLAAVPSLAGTPNIGRVLSAQPYFPWFAPVADFQDALASYGNGSEPGSATASAWVSGRMFEQAAGAVGGELTSAALVEALNQFAGESLGGITVPLTFGATPRMQPDCFFWVEINDAQWGSPQGTDPVCG